MLCGVKAEGGKRGQVLTVCRLSFISLRNSAQVPKLQTHHLIKHSIVSCI